MPRCIRCGCPNERATPDPIGLALCHTHNTEFRTGTIGQDHNPRQKQHPIDDAHHILATISQPEEPLRAIAARTGLTKDTVDHIRNRTWKHVRSAVWETLLDAQADYIYQQRHLSALSEENEVAHG